MNPKDMKIGIIGGGVVGHATARSFIEHVAEVRIYDVQAERRTHSLPTTLDTDLIFVCLPSPQRTDKLECDLSYIDKFFAAMKGSTRNFVLRSTVPVGTTKRLHEQYNLRNLVHSPEFLTARCSMVDAQIPARNIIGHCFYNGDGKLDSCLGELHELYHRRFPGVPILTMSSNESELVKLTLNAFFAVKVAFFNEAKTLMDAHGADYNTVLSGILTDGRVAHSHTKVPGPDGKYGFGGACLPKDLANFVDCLEKADQASTLSYAALRRNIIDRHRGQPPAEPCGDC